MRENKRLALIQIAISALFIIAITYCNNRWNWGTLIVSTILFFLVTWIVFILIFSFKPSFVLIVSIIFTGWLLLELIIIFLASQNNWDQWKTLVSLLVTTACMLVSFIAIIKENTRPALMVVTIFGLLIIATIYFDSHWNWRGIIVSIMLFFLITLIVFVLVFSFKPSFVLIVSIVFTGWLLLQSIIIYLAFQNNWDGWTVFTSLLVTTVCMLGFFIAIMKENKRSALIAITILGLLIIAIIDCSSLWGLTDTASIILCLLVVMIAAIIKASFKPPVVLVVWIVPTTWLLFVSVIIYLAFQNNWDDHTVFVSLFLTTMGILVIFITMLAPVSSFSDSYPYDSTYSSGDTNSDSEANSSSCDSFSDSGGSCDFSGD